MESGVKAENSKKVLDDFVTMFEEAEQFAETGHDLASRCRDYFDGNQITEEERVEIQKRGQPPIVINRVRPKIEWLRGLEMQSRTDPKAFPRTPQHEADADAATDAIRYVCDNTDWDKKRSGVWENMIVEGVGGAEVIHQFRPPMNEPEIVINRYSADRIFYDPHSSQPDFSDARYKGVVIWSDMDDLVKQYPDKKEFIAADEGASSTSDDIFEDRPHYQLWNDPKRNRARCVLMHYIENGTWRWVKFVKGGILESGESPYEDENGDPVCPLILQSAYISRENMRYGVVVDMLDPQDEVNKRRSKLLHQLNSRQTWGPAGGVASVSKMKSELAKPDGHVEVNPEYWLDGKNPFNIITNTDQTAGQFNLLQEAKAEIDKMGANSGLSGKEENSQSGRAIMARQRGGMIEISALTDQLAQFTREIYRQIWLRVRQFWTAEKWVRVTDDDRNVRFVGLNRPITLEEKLAEMDPAEVESIALANGLYVGDPRLQQVVGIENSVAEMDVDIILEEVPDQITLQGETFEQVVNLATSSPGSIPSEILIELAPGIRRDLKERLIGLLEQRAEAESQQGQAETQMQAQGLQAKIQKDEADAARSMAAAQAPTFQTGRLG